MGARPIFRGMRQNDNQSEDDPYSTPLGNVAYTPNQPQDQDLGTSICASYEEKNMHMAGGPRLVIVEQPMKETRYRYKSESGSHGPLVGQSSTQQRKTFHTVMLENYNVQLPHRLKASLVTAEDTARPHVHSITMRGRDDEDCCYVTACENGSAMFPNMSIVFQ
ncbi:hypothetical protein HPB52_010236 [Rhipicephalus sanguineus]|uniref:RHD domain-containing protein n=1 Tax=Rhipicephalus sanguineus TaxID=34632 RepID=A0A9D4YMY5_RHISA|nr:hypothetical protein HPB52_010236 [Rhipicephalus sanguineus]